MMPEQHHKEFTGLYALSIAQRTSKSISDVARVKKSLLSLKNQNSAYADEPRALLLVLEAVNKVYTEAKRTL